MYAPPSPRPRPKVAIPNTPKRRPTHRAPFPSWLPDPNTNPAVHDEPYDDDADTPLQRTISDSGTRHHGSRHASYRALPPLPADTTSTFLTEQPYTPSSTTAPQSIPPAQNYGNLYYPPSYEFAQQRPASFAEGTSSYNPNGGSMSFPEPELHRSFSSRSYHEYEPPPHRHTSSDFGPSAGLARSTSYAASFSDVGTPRGSTEELTDELSQMTLESEEGLKKFQAGELPAKDEEWHKLVPEAAREALGKKEVERQSVFFELFKAERDYVGDMEAVQEVFIEPLRESNAILNGVEEFIDEVFSNLSEILGYHQRMLDSLFARQREQHPLIQSVADVILETVLQFTNAYETYIKHYPIAEARHRAELARNPAYRAFIEKQAQVPRIRKRDLVTFISRPVTRLPRLSLVLEHIEKLTEADHPDLESMPLITGILGDLIKSTQPGIEAAENKVKFWSITSGLVFQRGDLIDMDLQDDRRALVMSGTLARKQRAELDWSRWNDYTVVLLDNFLLITREEKRSNGDLRYVVVSRPLSLAYLKMGQFDQPPENRKEKPDERGILDIVRFNTISQYPFTIYHAAEKTSRRYTLYTNTEAARTKWYNALKSALGVYHASHDANKWFAPNTINDGFFRMKTARVSAGSTQMFAGRITAATVFSRLKKEFVAVGCQDGIYVAVRGETQYRIVLRHQSPQYLFALPDFNRFLVHVDGMVLSYSLDLMLRLSQGDSTQQALNASMEKVSGQDTNVILFRAGLVKERAIVVYASKSFTRTTLNAFEVVKSPSRPRRLPGELLSYRSFGAPFYVPSKALDITLLKKTIAIVSDRGISIVDPTNLASSAIIVIPDFTQSSTDDQISALKSKCDSSRPLGMAHVDQNEFMVVYDEFGCFVTRHGVPRRNGQFVRWDIKATACAKRGDHVLLFSSEFVEVRHTATGRLVEVIPGNDIRLISTGPMDGQSVLLARIGKKNDQSGQSDELLELIQTSELNSPLPDSDMRVQRMPSPSRQRLWDEWDM